jgi:predicted membrane protein
MRYSERRRLNRTFNRGIWTIFMGSLFVILGILILFDNLDMISFKLVWKTYWPVLLILIGVLVILKRYTIPNFTFESKVNASAEFSDKSEDVEDQTSENVKPESEGEYKRSESEHSQSNVFGNVRYSSASKDYPGGNISNIFGDIFIDLSNIDFSEGTRHVTVSGVFGSLRIKLPPNIGAKFSGSTIAGTVKFLDEKKDGVLINLNSQTTDYDSSNKKLYIRASLIFGDMKVN